MNTFHEAEVKFAVSDVQEYVEACVEHGVGLTMVRVKEAIERVSAHYNLSQAEAQVVVRAANDHVGRCGGYDETEE